MKDVLAPPIAGVRRRVVATIVAFGLAPSAAFAQTDDAEAILKSMADYLASQQSLSFSYQSTIEAVTPDFEKLQFVSSGTLTLSRPDRIRVTRTGGFADLELVFDGSVFTVLGKNLNAYAQLDAPGNLAELADRLSNAGIDPPAADLLSPNAFALLTQEVTEAKHIASAFVGGVECEYLAFRTDETDWQIWIESGDRPVPLRYVITSKHVVQAPQYTIEIRDWQVGDQVAEADFMFEPPQGATKVELSQLELLDELPTPIVGDAE